MRWSVRLLRVHQQRHSGRRLVLRGEDLKTEEEAAIFGGTAELPYDACYHTACDSIGTPNSEDNINEVVLEEMADAMAHSTLTFAMTASAVNCTTKGSGTGNVDLEYKGNKLIK